MTKINIDAFNDIDKQIALNEYIPEIDNLSINSNSVADVFIYDTTLDDDHGTWTDETSNTSWYNETLNTATRGATKSFPKIALIVVEADKVTIYDATDIDCPMWMVFNTTGYTAGHLQHQGTSFDTVFFKNAIMYVGSGTGGLQAVDFSKDIT